MFTSFLPVVAMTAQIVGTAEGTLPRRDTAGVVAESHGDEQEWEDAKETTQRQAAEPPSAWKLRPLALEGHLGIATPTGGIGLTLDYALAPWLSFGCGAGTNFVGPEAECRLRLRKIQNRESALYLGAGASFGPHVQSDATRLGALDFFLAPLTQMREDLPPASREWSLAYWANIELGLEHRKLTGFTMRMYAGLAFLMNPDDGTAPDEDSDHTSGVVDVAKTLLYVGTSFGAAFGAGE